MALRVVATALAMLALGCASARTNFRAYPSSSARAPVLIAAVEAGKEDLPALGAAGAVIVGTVTTRGNGFAGPDYVRDAAAREAALRGGTHVVLGMTVQQSERGQRLQTAAGAALHGPDAKYYPGHTIELTALVLRVPDDVAWAALPAPLRPKPDVHVAHGALPRAVRPPEPVPPPSAEPAQAAPAAQVAPMPEPSSNDAGATTPPIEIDGSRIAPLPNAE